GPWRFRGGEPKRARVESRPLFAGGGEKTQGEPGKPVRAGHPLVSLAEGGGAPALSPPAPAPAKPAPRAIQPAPAAAPAVAGGPVAAAPSARRLAREMGVDLHAVRGSAPAGRITDDDVRATAANPPAHPKPPPPP